MKTNTILHILQQSEYDLEYFTRWYKKHQRDDRDLEPEKWTLKLKLIKIIFYLLFFLSVLNRVNIAVMMVSPFENLIRFIVYSLAQMKLTLFKLLGLKVVAIAGSYGKTSTKHIIKHTLKKEFATLMTPKSINTPLGIALIILKDLNLNHQLFLVEFGEFTPGDMLAFCKFVKPHYGVLTPIGRQHLERFGSLKKIVQNFVGFFEYFKNDLSKLLVAESSQKYFSNPKLSWYGSSEKSQYRIYKVGISRGGTEFCVTTPQSKNLKVFTPLYGEHQAVNALPVFWLGDKFRLNLSKLAKSLHSMPYIPHRHEPTFAENDVLILDNGYNSNPDSVKASLKLINQLKPTHRIIITMGFVELGEDSKKIHFKFGEQLADQVDFVGLIKAPDSQEIMNGFIKAGGKKSHLVIAQSQEEVLVQLQSKIIPSSVVLFENGVNEIYL